MAAPKSIQSEIVYKIREKSDQKEKKKNFQDALCVRGGSQKGCIKILSNHSHCTPRKRLKCDSIIFLKKSEENPNKKREKKKRKNLQKEFNVASDYAAKLWRTQQSDPSSHQPGIRN